MIKEESKENFDWVYSVLGAITGLLTAFVISGSILWSIAGAIIGLIIANMFLHKVVKGRSY
jgi:divalent metal cation (Fe/Co/Zn/Cd) transporter